MAGMRSSVQLRACAAMQPVELRPVRLDALDQLGHQRRRRHRQAGQDLAAGPTSFVSASYSRASARSRASERTSSRSSSWGTGQTRVMYSPRAGVDLDPVAGVDEQRHLDDEAGLQGGRLAGARHPVALHAGLGLGDRQLDRRGRSRTCTISPSNVARLAVICSTR